MVVFQPGAERRREVRERATPPPWRRSPSAAKSPVSQCCVVSVAARPHEPTERRKGKSWADEKASWSRSMSLHMGGRVPVAETCEFICKDSVWGMHGAMKSAIVCAPHAMAAIETSVRATAALDDLYRRHVGDVYRYCYAVLGNHADAEDVTQTTFVNALRALERGEEPRNPSQLAPRDRAQHRPAAVAPGGRATDRGRAGPRRRRQRRARTTSSSTASSARCSGSRRRSARRS